MENNTTIVSAFRKFLTERAAREGVDVSALQIEEVTTDRTWGDKVGFVFFGCTDEVNERVAACFERFAAKHMTSGSYEAQRSIGLQGPRFFHEYSNGVKSWSTNGEVSTCSPNITLVRPIVKGYSVSTTYYPCAD
jgi:hypothetical protein